MVMGWRPGKEEGTVGSLILGLYDGGELRTVGHISGFSAAAKRSMRTMLAPLETGESGTAEPSRWTGGRDLEWVALRPELVIEVGYDHAAAGRIRHGARFQRFRDDKEPSRVPVRAAGRRGLGRRGPRRCRGCLRWMLGIPDDEAPAAEALRSTPAYDGWAGRSERALGGAGERRSGR